MTNCCNKNSPEPKWSDLSSVPILKLKDGVKDFVELSFGYWSDWLSKNTTPTCASGDAEAPECAAPVEVEEPKVALDLAAILLENQAVAEKYQATGAESLLNHLAAQLASVRKTDKSDVLDEITTALFIPEDKRELLAMSRVDRAEFLSQQVVGQNPGLVQAVVNNDSAAIAALDVKAVDAAYGLVDAADLKFALRHALRGEIKRLEEIEQKPVEE